MKLIIRFAGVMSLVALAGHVVGLYKFNTHTLIFDAVFLAIWIHAEWDWRNRKQDKQ